MVVITEKTILDQLRNDLETRGRSHREIEAWLKSSIRHKLTPGSPRGLKLGELLRVLEIAKIDKADFFARLAQLGGPWLVVLATTKKDIWTRDQRDLVEEVAKVDRRGIEGYAEVRGELRRIERLCDEDRETATAEAWELLSRSLDRPGALAGVLAMLAVGQPRANAYRLLGLAFELVGLDMDHALGGKLLMALGRCLAEAGLHHDALGVFKRHALPVITIHGDVEEHAAAAYSIGLCASFVGDLSSMNAALEKTMSIGDDRMCFAALQLLAAQQLNCGQLSRAADMYDELVEMPYFTKAEATARVTVVWTRMTAHFLAGRLGRADQDTFEEAVAATKILGRRDQVLAKLDLALFLKTIGEERKAAKVLKAEQWNVLGLEDTDIHEKFASQWKALGLPKEAWESLLASRKATRPRRPHPRANPPVPGQVPTSQAEGPTR